MPIVLDKMVILDHVPDYLPAAGVVTDSEQQTKREKLKVLVNEQKTKPEEMATMFTLPYIWILFHLFQCL